MTAKEYLSRPRELEEEILNDKDEIAAMRSSLESCTAHLSHTAGCNPSHDNRAFEDMMAKIADMEKMVDGKTNRLLALKAETLEMIRLVKNKQYCKLLRMLYVEEKSWAEAAQELKLTENRVMSLHREAIKKLDRVLHNSK